MMLPDGHQKTATKLYEQVVIPPADQAPVGVGRNLVPISHLDEVYTLDWALFFFFFFFSPFVIKVHIYWF